MYKIGTNLQGSQFIFRVSDEAFIPVDSNNRDYQEYLVWAAVAGNLTH